MTVQMCRAAEGQEETISVDLSYYTTSNAEKVMLCMHDIPLVAHFSGANYISCDMSNPHFTSLGERSI